MKPSLPSFFGSVDQLVRQTGIQWIVEDDTISAVIGEDAERGSTLRLYHDGKLLIKGNKEALDKVMSGQYAYVVEKLTALKVLIDGFDTRSGCEFYLTAKPLFSIPYGMIFQESSTVVPMLLNVVLTDKIPCTVGFVNFFLRAPAA